MPSPPSAKAAVTSGDIPSKGARHSDHRPLNEPLIIPPYFLIEHD